jgi:hypothetical protein
MIRLHRLVIPFLGVAIGHPNSSIGEDHRPQDLSFLAIEVLEDSQTDIRAAIVSKARISHGTLVGYIKQPPQTLSNLTSVEFDALFDYRLSNGSVFGPVGAIANWRATPQAALTIYPVKLEVRRTIDPRHRGKCLLGKAATATDGTQTDGLIIPLEPRPC